MLLVKQIFVVAQLHAGCGVHLKGHRAVVGVQGHGGALAAGQDTGQLAHAVGVGADELCPDLLALELLVVLRAGQLAAQAGVSSSSGTSVGISKSPLSSV